MEEEDEAAFFVKTASVHVIDEFVWTRYGSGSEQVQISAALHCSGLPVIYLERENLDVEKVD